MSGETQKRIGWIIVALILVWDGFQKMLSGKLYGKIRMEGRPPLEGWYVHVLGGLVLVFGLFLLWRMIMKIREGD